MQPKGLLKFLRLEGFLQNVQEYVENRIAITKLEAKQKIADIASTLAALIPAALFALFALTFLSLALAMAINVWLDSAVWGFVIVGVIYLIGAGVMFSMRDSDWLKKKIVDGSTQFLKAKSPEQSKEEEVPAGYQGPTVEHKKIIFEDPELSEEEYNATIVAGDREPVSKAQTAKDPNAVIVVESESEEEQRTS